MLKLNIKTEAYWLDLGMDVRVKVRPCTSPIFYAARAFMNAKLRDIGEQIKACKTAKKPLGDLPDVEDSVTREGLADRYFTLGLARASIIEWKGILENDSDKIAPVTRENIEQLFEAYWPVVSSFSQQYTGVFELAEAEKKSLKNAQNGTLATGKTTAKTARQPVKNVPMKSTSSKL